MADFNIKGEMSLGVAPFLRSMMKAEAAMAKAERQLKSFDRALDKVDRKNVNVKIGADTNSAMQAVSRLEQRMNRLRNKTVRVSTVTTGNAPTAASNSSATATTTVNVRGAERAAAQLAEIEAARRRLDGQNIVTRVLLRGADEFNSGMNSMSANIKKFPSSLLVSGITTIGLAAIPVGGVLAGALAGGLGATATALSATALGAAPMITAFMEAKEVGERLAAVQERLASGKGSAEEIARDQEMLAGIMNNTSPQMLAFIDNLETFKQTAKNFGSSFQDDTFATMNRGMALGTQLMERMEPVARNAAGAIGSLVTSAQRRFDTGEWENFYSYLEQSGGRFIQSFGNTVMDFATGIGNMIVALDPLSTDFANFMSSSASDFKKWSQDIANSQGFQDFISYVRENGPKVWALIKEGATFVGNLVTALAPLGAAVVEFATGILQLFNSFADANPALFEMVTQGAALALVFSGLLGPLGGVLGLLGSTGGGLGLLARGFGGLTSLAGGLSSMLQGTNGTVNRLATGAGVLTERLTGSANAGQRAMGFIGGVGKAIPIAAAALAAYSLVSYDGTERTNAWTTALNEGGAAAANATSAYRDAKDQGFWSGVWESATLQDIWNDDAAENVVEDYEAASQATREYRDSLSPLQQAQFDVTRETNDLSYAIGTYGEGSAEAREAARNLAYAQGEVLAAEQALTDAMTTGAQARQIATQNATDLASAEINASNASVGFTTAQRDLASAQQALTDLQNSGTATAAQLQAASDNVTTSQNNLTTAALGSAEAARQLAVKQNEGKSSADQAKAGSDAYITSLFNMARQADGPTKTALNNVIAAALGIPGEIYTEVSANTATAVAQLDALTATRYMTIIATTVQGSSSRTASTNNLARQIEAASNATGGVNPKSQWSMVGEQGPEMRWLNRGDFISTAAESKAILKAQKMTQMGSNFGESSTTNAAYATASGATYRASSVGSGSSGNATTSAGRTGPLVSIDTVNMKSGETASDLGNKLGWTLVHGLPEGM